MPKKASSGNSAAQIATAVVDSNSLITFTTVDENLIFEGAKVTVVGITGVTGVTPNVTNAVVYKVNTAKSFSVKPTTDFTYASTFPVSLAVASTATVYSINGSIAGTSIAVAQPERVKRARYFNFVVPEITTIASGNRVLLTWNAAGISNPVASVAVTRTLGTSVTSISTSAVGTNVLDPAGADLVGGTEYTYTITAINDVSTKTKVSKVTALFINPVSVTASATASTQSSVSVSWSAPVTNTVVTNYEVQRSSNGTTFTTVSTTSGVVTSYVDSSATYTDNWTYRVRPLAVFATAAGGTVLGSYATTSAISPYYVLSTTPAVTTIASTANQLLVSWTAPASNPAITSYTLQRATSSNNSTWSAWSDVTLASPTATSYTETAATSALFYKYQLRVNNAQLSSAFVESNSLQAFYLNDPLTPAPTVTRASTSNANLVVSGSYVANPSITAYEIRRSSDAGLNWTTVATSAASLPYTDSTTAQNTTYIYQVKATNGELTTANWSASSTSILTYAVPNPPTSVSTSNIAATSLTVNWSGATVNAAGPAIANYRVDYKVTSTTTWTTLSSAISSSSVSYNVTGLTTDTAYNFRVFAINTVGTSSASSTLTATPVRIAGTATLTSDSVSSTSVYYNLSKTLTATTNPGRSVQFQISTDNSTWSNLGTAITANATTGVATTTWTSDTVDAWRYFRVQVAQNDFYTLTTSGSISIYNYKNPLSITISNSNSGNTRYASVNVKDAAGNNVDGVSIGFDLKYFDVARYRHANTTTDASGNASTSFTLAESWAMYGIASKTNYVSATSGDTVQYVDQTFNTDATSSRSYKSNGALRADYATNDRCYYGYYDSSNGNQRSAVWFSDWYNPNATDTWDRINNAYSLTGAYVYIKRGSSAGAPNNGTVRIGIHENNDVTNSWTTLTENGVATNLQSFTLDHDQANGTFPTGADVTTAFRPYTTKNSDRFIYGITVGPGSSSSYVAANYGWLYGANVTGQPYITFVVQADPYY